MRAPSSRAPSSENGPVTTVLGLMRRTAQLMVEELTERLRAAGFDDIVPAHHVVFENIDRAGTRLTTLANRSGMTHQAMGELVTALEERGYLERVPDPDDRRARLVRLTIAGQRLARVALQEIGAIERRWAAGWTDAGPKAELRAVLDAGLRGADARGWSAGDARPSAQVRTPRPS